MCRNLEGTQVNSTPDPSRTFLNGSDEGQYSQETQFQEMYLVVGFFLKEKGGGQMDKHYKETRSGH